MQNEIKHIYFFFLLLLVLLLCLYLIDECVQHLYMYLDDYIDKVKNKSVRVDEDQENKLEEIALNAQLSMVKAKNELFKNLEKEASIISFSPCSTLLNRSSNDTAVFGLFFLCGLSITYNSFLFCEKVT